MWVTGVQTCALPICRLVGYDSSSKAYRIYLDSGSIRVTGDVIFCEDEEDNAAAEPSSQPPTSAPTAQLPTSAPAAAQLPTSAGPDNEDPDWPDYIPLEPEVAADNFNIIEDPDSPRQQSPRQQSPRQPPEQEQRYPKRRRNPPTEWWALTATDGEPLTMEEALASKDAAHWQQAMDEEMAAHQEHNTWTVEQPPPTVKTIPVK